MQKHQQQALPLMQLSEADRQWLDFTYEEENSLWGQFTFYIYIDHAGALQITTARIICKPYRIAFIIKPKTAPGTDTGQK